MQITISIDTEKVFQKDLTELTPKDEAVLDKAKENLPKKVVKLPEDESQVDQLPDAKPLIYVIKKGDSLKSISEKYGISYGLLSNHLMRVEGNTSLHEGQEIEIPRHFIDMSKA